MFLIESEKALIECFRPLDRDALTVPDGVKFPLYVRDYLNWLEPSGARVFLVFAEPGSRKPLGVAFRRDQSGGPASAMCDWCKTYGSGNEIGLLTAASNEHKRVGKNLCRDLGCKNRLENAANLSGRTTHDLSKKLIEEISVFARRTLF